MATGSAGRHGEKDVFDKCAKGGAYREHGHHIGDDLVERDE
jgi:hypothetical protein